jgi:hypothetical protein
MLDTGREQPGIFIWTGKEAAKGSKKKAMLVAGDFLAKEKRPEYTCMARVRLVVVLNYVFEN